MSMVVERQGDKGNPFLEEYNENLKRYYNGCKYCEEHKSEIDKWLPELLKILENINSLLVKIMEHRNVSTEEILEGFKQETDGR